MKKLYERQHLMPNREQVITLLESFIIAAVILTLSGLLHKNDSDREEDLEIREVVTLSEQEPSQQALTVPLNLHLDNGSLITSEARQVGDQGAVYADLTSALPNNLAAIFCKSPCGPSGIKLYNKSILGYLTITGDRIVTISQKFSECGSVFLLPEGGGNMQVYDTNEQCKVRNLYITVDDITKQLVATDNSKDAANFKLLESPNCPQIQCELSPQNTCS